MKECRHFDIFLQYWHVLPGMFLVKWLYDKSFDPKSAHVE